MIKKISFLVFIAILMSSCHESLEDRAAREAKEYTEKNCPTPVVNYTRTDSVVFDKNTKTYHYYCSVSDKMDDARIINLNQQKIADLLGNRIKEETGTRKYKEAGFKFAYTLRSTKNPKQILFEKIYTPKDYK